MSLRAIWYARAYQEKKEADQEVGEQAARAPKQARRLYGYGYPSGIGKGVRMGDGVGKSLDECFQSQFS